MVQSRWNIIYQFCAINDVTLNELFCDVSEALSGMMDGKEKA